MATVTCRPDLGPNTMIGGGLFAVYYLIFMRGLLCSAPGYIGRVRNLSGLSGAAIYRILLEEILFGFTFGMYWSGIYEHLTWRGSVRQARERRRTMAGRA